VVSGLYGSSGLLRRQEIPSASSALPFRLAAIAGKKALKCDLWITDSAAHKSRHEEMLILSRNVLPAYIIQSALFRRPANVPRLPIVAPRSL
jgi:hypothetical protein